MCIYGCAFWDAATRSSDERHNLQPVLQPLPVAHNASPRQKQLEGDRDALVSSHMQELLQLNEKAAVQAAKQQREMEDLKAQ